MRGTWIIAAACGGLVACAAPERVTLEHRAKLPEQTRGVALSADGTLGQAGMWGTTCDFRTHTGALLSDYDYPGADEEVQDGTDDPDIGFATVTVSTEGVHVTWPDETHGGPISVDHPQEDHAVSDARHGRLVDGAVVVLHLDDEGCAVRWFDHGNDAPSHTDRLPESACARNAEVAVDRDERDVFVATDEGVIVASEDGWDVIPGVEADLLAWDPWADVLYASDRGAREVVAVERDGVERWREQVGGRVHDLSHLGAYAAAAVSVQADDGAGRFVVLDGWTGTQRSDLETPSASDTLVTSDDGTVLALVLADEVHFYDVRPVE